MITFRAIPAAVAVEMRRDGRPIGLIVSSLQGESLFVHWFVGDGTGGLTEAADTFIAEVARQAGLRRIEAGTMRPGLIRRLAARGWRIMREV